jgi:hypothetical protein
MQMQEPLLGQADVRPGVPNAPHSLSHPCWQPTLYELFATSRGSARIAASAISIPTICQWRATDKVSEGRGKCELQPGH